MAKNDAIRLKTRIQQNDFYLLGDLLMDALFSYEEDFKDATTDAHPLFADVVAAAEINFGDYVA